MRVELGEEPVPFLAQGGHDTRAKKIFAYLCTCPKRKIAYFASQVPYNRFVMWLPSTRTQAPCWNGHDVVTNGRSCPSERLPHKHLLNSGRLYNYRPSCPPF